MAELCADKETDFRAILPFLRKLPRHIDMLRFFDRASYYSLHGHDAHTVAAVYKTRVPNKNDNPLLSGY